VAVTAKHQEQTARRPKPASTDRLRKFTVAPASNGLIQAGELGWLFYTVCKEAILHPRGYWGEVRDQMFLMLRLCWVPVIVSSYCFGVTVGYIFVQLFGVLGIPERLGSPSNIAVLREFGTYTAVIVVAGVIGTAMTADLGARKIREELDALEVLGLNPMRLLVVPRVIALTFMAVAFNFVSFTAGIAGVYTPSLLRNGVSPQAFLASFFDSATLPELWGAVGKTAVCGLFLAVVCCYKGLSVGAGPIGVGRAVNQAVVICVAAFFTISLLWNQVLVALNPNVGILR
jgi:phospholipid/cholesterol/gamma-HCH transport system permease protein